MDIVPHKRMESHHKIWNFLTLCLPERNIIKELRLTARIPTQFPKLHD